MLLLPSVQINLVDTTTHEEEEVEVVVLEEDEDHTQLEGEDSLNRSLLVHLMIPVQFARFAVILDIKP